MTANDGMKFLLKIEEKLQENIFNEDSVVCVIARAGSAEPISVAGAIKDLINRDFGPPLHTLVIPGKLHFMEIEALHILAQLPAQQGGKLQKL
jgi:diphthine synthase